MWAKHSAVKLFLSNDLDIQGIVTKAIESPEHKYDVVKFAKDVAIHHGCLGGELEPLPSSHNRVQLDKDRLDPLGLPLPRIHYELDDYVKNGMTVWLKFAHDLIEKMGAHQVSSSIAHSSHHPSGTARMGLDMKLSVVNENCRSHDHDNLYILGGSVFPSMGTANPTLTIAALSLRLAEHLLEVS